MDKQFYRSFEEKHRGTRELIKSRHKVYLPFILPFLELFDPTTALDLGCGRGEWLELLREVGFETYGVDLDDAMLGACRKLGLSVATADAIETLIALRDETQAVVSGFHIVEHLPFQQVQRLVEEAHRVLKPGGLLILETPNPENIVVGSCSFYLDPTHQHPIPPQLLSFVPEFSGFARTKIMRLQEVPGLLSGQMLTLKDILAGVSPDYAVVAQKGGPDALLSLFDEAFAKDYGIDLDTLADRYTAQAAAEEAKRIELRQDLQTAFQRVAWIETALELVKAKAQTTEMLMAQTEAALTAADTRASQAEAALTAADTRASQAEEQGERSSVRAAQIEAALELARARAQTAETRAAQTQAALTATETRASQAEEQGERTRAALVAAEAGLCDLARASEANVAALRGSTSWQLTRPVRVASHLLRGRVGLALMEVGILREQVERLADILGYRHGSGVPRRQIVALDLEPAKEPERQAVYADDVEPQRLSPEAGADLSHFPPIARRVYLDLAAGQQMLRDSAPASDEDEAPLPSANEGGFSVSPPPRRLRLAFVSPLPPERTGIAEYSQHLLKALMQHYDIDLIVCQDEIADDLITSEMPIREVEWLKANLGSFDWVIYQIGNSQFHTHMLALMDEIPGTVVLHDFFLSHLLAHLEVTGLVPNIWVRQLYESHGYLAVQDRFERVDIESVVMMYPANIRLLEGACGVIVHSEEARRLANKWYGANFGAGLDVIPLVREPTERLNRESARVSLGLPSDSFVVCSFGMASASKCTHRLLEAWLHSRLAGDRRCLLIFVGEAPAGDYGDRLQSTIVLSTLEERVCITGWVDTDTYQQYLAAADVAVQLRTLSRGETSAAVLDCMNSGLPVIVNAHGSLEELPSDSVLMLPDEFEDVHLTEALETLWSDGNRRIELGRRAADVVATINSPKVCAAQYADTIEKSRARYAEYRAIIAETGRGFDFRSATEGGRRAAALEVARSLQIGRPQKQLLLDVSATRLTNLRSGIERVARALILALLRLSPPGYRVEPVYRSNEGGHWHYRYASRFTLGLLNCPEYCLSDEVVVPRPGDQLLGLDLDAKGLIDADSAGLFEEFKAAGVRIRFLVHDLLPLQMPEVFPPGADISFRRWLEIVTRMDGAICVSKAVADELRAWVNRKPRPQTKAFSIDWSHHGADLESSAPSSGKSEDFEHYIKYFSSTLCFLMVGTIEPRKGHLQAIEAFSQLWLDGCDVNLIIVGNEGWKGLPDSMRRTIPDTVKRLRGHSEFGKRLFWFDNVSDECLDNIYQASNCLIVASRGEGFGLPIIEAARRKLPVIARDIPVFREVAGDHAFYFSGERPDDLTSAVRAWLQLHGSGTHPNPDGLQWLTWRESAKRLLRILPCDNVAPAANGDPRIEEGAESD